MRRLYAGPWYGEFGWEIMAWQGYLRSLVDKYDQIIVSGPTGHEGMYEYADKYISFDVPTTHANMWMNSPYEQRAEEHRKLYIGPDEFSGNGKVDWITPEKALENLLKFQKSEIAGAVNWIFEKTDRQKFIRFGGETGGYDIIYHARNRDDWDSSYRNWFPEHCQETLNHFKDRNIACIGRQDAAFHIDGTEDLRDMPLSELMPILANSRIFVGPISGPTHLATLCGLPQMTWAVKAEHKNRVEKVWNPFNTPVHTIVADDMVWHKRIEWTPPVKEIVGGIEEMLNE